MAPVRSSRRSFLAGSLGALAAAPLFAQSTRPAAQSPGDRLRIGAIGLRYQGSVIAEKAQAFGDIVAICDVDRQIAEKARAQFGGTATLFEHYHDLLARDDIDVVTIGTPDHWHTAMVIDACRAGKDIYVEKPLTLTVDEGRLLTRVVQETGRIVQVGSWQRSDHRFRLACELVRGGRIGRLRKVTVVLGKNVQGGPFARPPVPAHFNWNLWQGQTPDVPYIAERSHYTFRWWHEYSGGQMTDWGAHHLDIARWAIGEDAPLEIEGVAKFPAAPDSYNVAVDFQARMTFPGGVVLEVLDNGRNGILFEGEAGRLFVNRGSIEGLPVEELAARPLPRDAFRLYDFDNLNRPERMGKLDAIINHMGNFHDCILTRRRPVSDVESQHRSVSLCHLANIALWTGRRLRWDAARQDFAGDVEASRHLRREQRKGFEIA